MRTLTLAQAAQMAGGTCSGSGLVTNVTLDSRQATEGSLFVALRGEKVDGHQFVADVLNLGGFAMVRRDTVKLPGIIEVDDPLKGLQNLARAYLRQYDLPIVAVTGSNGKTTTKDMITRVLHERFEVHSSAKNYNNELGLPLTVLGLDDTHQALVVEMGMRGIGQIRELTEICPPKIAVITNVGPVHLEILKSMENIAQAKAEIIEALPPNGLAVLNGDDPWVRRIAGLTQAQALFYGQNPDNDLVISELEIDRWGRASFCVEGLGVSGRIALNVPGRHNVWNASAALIVGLKSGVPFAACAAALADVQLTGMRLETIELKNGALILNDAYNASPASMRAALDTVAALNRTGEKIAILGDMLELGPISEDAHREIGAYAASCCSKLLFVGRWAEVYRAGAGRGEVFSSVEELLENLPTLNGGDLALIKASRGLRLERVVERLKEGD